MKIGTGQEPMAVYDGEERIPSIRLFSDDFRGEPIPELYLKDEQEFAK